MLKKQNQQSLNRHFKFFKLSVSDSSTIQVRPIIVEFFTIDLPLCE